MFSNPLKKRALVKFVQSFHILHIVAHYLVNKFSENRCTTELLLNQKAAKNVLIA